MQWPGRVVPIDTAQDAIDMCATVSATPVSPQSSVENEAAYAQVTGAFALLGGIRVYDPLSDLIIWKWYNPSPYAGEIFWASPNDGNSDGGYAPAGSYASWWEGIVNRDLIQGTNLSYLIIESSWFIPNVSTSPCVICEQEACSSACVSEGTDYSTGTWWPDCVCTCKPGWVGIACSRQVGVYPITAVASADDLVAFCAAKGGYVAQPTTRAEEDEILRIVPVNGGTDFAQPVAIGATANDATRTYCYRDGRLDGECVAQDGSPTAVYSDYGNGVPPTPTTTPSTVLRPLSYSSGRWTASAPGDVMQVACQFVMCSQFCEPLSTGFYSGTYPNCVCNCSTGFVGNRCQSVVVVTRTATATTPQTLSQGPTHSVTLSAPVSDTLTAPHTSTPGHTSTDSLEHTLTDEMTLSGAVAAIPTATLTLPRTGSVSSSDQAATSTSSLPETLTLTHQATLTDEMTLTGAIAPITSTPTIINTPTGPVSTQTSTLPSTTTLTPGHTLTDESTPTDEATLTGAVPPITATPTDTVSSSHVLSLTEEVAVVPTNTNTQSIPAQPPAATHTLTLPKTDTPYGRYRAVCLDSVVSSFDQAIDMCAAQSATPVSPQSSAENEAAYAQVGPVGTNALLGGSRLYDNVSGLALWVWNTPSANQGEIFWVAPSGASGYAPTGAYAAWWSGVNNAGVDQGTNLSFLTTASSWFAPNVTMSTCVICDQEACSSACIAEGTETYSGTWWPNCRCNCKPGHRMLTTDSGISNILSDCCILTGTC